MWHKELDIILTTSLFYKKKFRCTILVKTHLTKPYSTNKVSDFFSSMQFYI